MSWESTYQSRLVSVGEAASLIKSGDRVWYGGASSCPVDVMHAVAARMPELENVTVYSGLVFYPFEFLTSGNGHIHHSTIFMGPYERQGFEMGHVSVIPNQFSRLGQVTRDSIKPNVAIFEVSPPDENGNMSLGPVGALNGHDAAQCADTVIVQVNKETPYIYGPPSAFVRVDDVDAICEADHPLFELANPPISETDRLIAANIVEHVEDRATIQLGIGGVANAVGMFLENHKDLGIHTEMLVDSMITLAEKGVITGKHKTLNPGEITIGFGIGSKGLYDFVHRNESVRQYPIEYVNDVRTISQNDNFNSINGILMADLTGQVCSESIGFRQFSGTGGQLDFVRGAGLSKGGKAFLAFPSMAEKEDGTKISKIVATLPPGTVVTTPRTDADYLVTEQGVAELRGKSITERVNAVISIAHPELRDELRQEARSNGLL